MSDILNTVPLQVTDKKNLQNNIFDLKKNALKSAKQNNFAQIYDQKNALSASTKNLTKKNPPPRELSEKTFSANSSERPTLRSAPPEKITAKITAKITTQSSNNNSRETKPVGDSPIQDSVQADSLTPQTQATSAESPANISDVSDKIGDNISGNIGDNISGNIGDNISGNISGNIGGNIGDKIGGNIGGNIGDKIGGNIGDKISNKISGEDFAHITDILQNPDLSLEDKIKMLADIPALNDLPATDKTNIFAFILNEHPDLKDKIFSQMQDFITSMQENTPLEQTDSAHMQDVLKTLQAQTERLDLSEKEKEILQEMAVAFVPSPIMDHAPAPTTESNILPEGDLSITAKIENSLNAPTENIEKIDLSQTKPLENAGDEKIFSAPIMQKFQNLDDDLQSAMQGTQEHSILTDLGVAPPTNSTASQEKPILIESKPSLDKTVPDLLSMIPQNSLNSNNPLLESGKTVEKTVIATVPLENQITLKMTRSKDAPEQIGINLEPAGMGEAELIIENKDNVITAIIRSEKPETLDMIRKESASLEKHLQQAGINLSGGGLQFQHKQSSDSQNQNNQTNTHYTAPVQESLVNNRPQITPYQQINMIDLSKGVDIRL